MLPEDVAVVASKHAIIYKILFYHITSLKKEFLSTKGLVAMEYKAWFPPPRLRGKNSPHEGTGGHAVLDVVLTVAPLRKTSRH
uniref:(California timema) hypothetical protein n=1 Tax=Timema californicum TaxID=61474 RepID=A0A7R9JDP5_TIMCA|nr:unnamed protein product [Timema californicum]